MRKPPLRTVNSKQAPNKSLLKGFSGFNFKFLFLLGIVFVVVFAIVSTRTTINAYVKGQKELTSLKNEVNNANQNLDNINAQIKRWSDQAFIEAQARTRLGFVKKGEKPYKLINENSPKKTPKPKPSKKNSTPSPKKSKN